MFAIFALLLEDAIFGYWPPLHIFRLFQIQIWRMAPLFSWYLMSLILFSSFQFKFAQYYIWVMKNIAKHKTMLHIFCIVYMLVSFCYSLDPVAQLAVCQICNLMSIKGPQVRTPVRPYHFLGDWPWNNLSTLLIQEEQLSVTGKSMVLYHLENVSRPAQEQYEEVRWPARHDLNNVDRKQTNKIVLLFINNYHVDGNQRVSVPG